MALNLGDDAGGSGVESQSGVEGVGSEPTIYLEAENEPLLPGGSFAFDADYSRHGWDLVLAGEDAGRVVVKGYFELAEGLDLWTEDGHFFPHHLIENLAGPQAPGLYAEVSAGPGSEEIGKVAAIEGEVWAVRTDGVKEALEQGASVFQGDVLETAGAASVEVIFVDGMEFSMGGNTRISIDEMIYNPDQSVGSSLLSVVKGSFIFVTGWIAGTGEDAMQVKTPSGTIGIRGTRVGCAVDSQSGNTACSLLEGEAGHVGKLAFTNATGTVLLTQLFETVVGISFDAELSTRTLSEIELRSLLGEIYDEAALETDAPPIVKSSGSVFLEPDFDVSSFEGLEILVAAGVLGEVATLVPLEPPLAFDLLDFVVLEDGLVQTPTASLSVGEDGVQAGSPVTGDLSFAIDGELTATVGIEGVNVTAAGASVVLASGGNPVEFRLEDNGQTMVGFVPPGAGGPQTGSEVFVLSLDPAAGTFSFTLEAPLDHFDPTATGPDDTILLSFTVAAAAGGLNVTTQIDVNVQDDGPRPVDTVATPDFAVSTATEVPAGSPEEDPAEAGSEADDESGLLIAIDVSTSMNTELTLANGETTTRLALTKLAAENLGRKFFEIGTQTGADHRLSLVVFADGIQILSPSDSFTDFAAFAQAVRSVTDANGYSGVNDGTNFFGAVEAIDDVVQTQLLSQQGADASNSIYFISDGFVTVGRPVSESGWEDFLGENGIASVAVAVDPGDESVAALLEVNSPDGPGDPIILTGADDLASDLGASVQPVSQGNVLLDPENAALGLTDADDFGADGFQQIISLEVDGTTYSYDVENDVIAGGPGGPTAGSQLSLSTLLGGQLDFDFSSGDYRYQGAGYDHPTERFTYGVSDRDGDIATADLVVNPDSFVFSLTQHPAGSFTLIGFDQTGNSIEITDVIDSDQDGDSDIDDLIGLGATLSQDAVTLAVTLALDADTSFVLDGIGDQISSIQELNDAVNLVISA